MKLLFSIPSLAGGGAERVMTTLVNYFGRDEHQVAIMCDTSVAPAYHLSENISLYNQSEGVLSSKSKWDIIKNSYRIRKNIKSITKAYNPDIVISFIVQNNINVLAALKGTRYPVIVSEHTHVLRNTGIANRIQRPYYYKYAAAVTVLTDYDYNIWKHKFDKVVVMHNPVDCKGAKNGVRENTVLAVGRVDSWFVKGFDNLIKSWAIISDKFPDWQLKIAGAGNKEDFDFLRALANECNTNNIEFLGFRTDIRDLMEKSSIFVLTSRVEGLPMALIEAMDAGACCVSFDVVTGPSEIIRHNQDGLIVKNQSVEDMASVLEKVMGNKEEADRLRSNAPYSVQRFETKYIVAKWYELINEVIK